MSELKLKWKLRDVHSILMPLEQNSLLEIAIYKVG